MHELTVFVLQSYFKAISRLYIRISSLARFEPDTRGHLAEILHDFITFGAERKNSVLSNEEVVHIAFTADDRGEIEEER